MSQTAYIIDNSPTSRDIINQNTALEAFKLHVLENINSEIVDNREASIIIINLNQTPQLACPLINLRFPLQEAIRNLTFAPQFTYTSLTQNNLFDTLKLAQMALNQRVNKQVKPRITALICTKIEFSAFEKECKLLKKEGCVIKFMLALEATEQYDKYVEIGEKINEDCEVQIVENESFLVVKNEVLDDEDEELKAVLQLSRNEFMAQQAQQLQ